MASLNTPDLPGSCYGAEFVINDVQSDMVSMDAISGVILIGDEKIVVAAECFVETRRDLQMLVRWKVFARKHAIAVPRFYVKSTQLKYCRVGQQYGRFINIGSTTSARVSFCIAINVSSYNIGFLRLGTAHLIR